MRNHALLIIAIGLCMIAPASADSLWVAASHSMTSDVKAHLVGDLVTIVIVETSSTSQKASTDFSKKLDHSNSAGVGPLMSILPQFGMSGSQSGSASGTTTSSTAFTARMTAKVTKVLPNGALELQGQRTIQTNADKQTITLTGLVRQEDITTDNSVLSTAIADAQIKTEGKGPVGDRQKEGLISKLLKLLF